MNPVCPKDIIKAFVVVELARSEPDLLTGGCLDLYRRDCRLFGVSIRFDGKDLATHEDAPLRQHLHHPRGEAFTCAAEDFIEFSLLLLSLEDVNLN